MKNLITNLNIYRLICTLVILYLSAGVYAVHSDAELIKLETNITIKRGKLISDVSYVIKINNRNGEKYSKISIPCSGISRVSNVSAFITDTEGNVIKELRRSDISERSSIRDFSLYEDTYLKEFTLKHNIFPYLINYSYTRKENSFFYIDYWIPVIDNNVPTRLAKLTLNIPANYEIAHNENLVGEPLVKSDDGEKTFTWISSYTKHVGSEINAPHLSSFLPSVKIVPLEFSFDKKGSLESWESFGHWQCSLLEGLDELPQIEKDKINNIIDDEKNKKEILRKLYHYLQDETRYINVTVETGGLRPYPASYVAKNKYGDCKALTNYFRAVLAYAGIESFYTKVYAGNTVRRIDKSFPSQQSNHIILFIPLAQDTVWLDCTSDKAFGYLGTFSQNRKAFVIDKDYTSRFINTPPLTTDQVKTTRKVKIGLHGRAVTATFNIKCRGEMYESLSGLEKELTPDERFRVIRDYFVSEGFDLDNYELSSVHRDSAEISLWYTASSKNLYKFYGNDILINNIPFDIPRYKEPGSRKLPVQIDYPVYRIDTLVYEIPHGYKPAAGLENILIEREFGSYSSVYSVVGNSLEVVRKLLIKRGYYKLNRYEEFYNFINDIQKSEKKTSIILTK